MIGIRLAATCPDFENLVLRYNTVRNTYALFLYSKNAGDYFSTCCWTDSPCRWIILVHVFILSVLAAGVIFPSAGLFESSVQYFAYAKYRPNVVPLGDFNFTIIPENVDIMNSNPSAGILNGYFPSIEPKKDTLIS